jgi:O-antigen/teichoic acid export membrane protein
MACASFATAAVTLRYEIAIPNAAKDSDADALLLLSIVAALPLSLLLSGLIFLLVKFDVLSLGRLPLWSAFALVPTLLVTGLFCALRFWLVRKKDFHTISKVLVVQGTVRGVVPILLGLLQMNWTGLMLGEIAARFSGVYKMFQSALPALRHQLRQHGWQSVFRAGRENWSLPGLVLPSALLDLLALTLPVPLIAYYYGPAAAGVFFIAQRLTTLPVSFIGASVADVFHTAIAEAFRNRPAEVKPMLIQTMARLAKLGLAILGPLAVLAPFVSGRLFGGQYAQAGSLAAVLFPWCFAQLISSPLSRLLVVADRNAFLLLFDVLALAAVLLGFYIGHARRFSFLQCTGLVSALMTLAYAAYAATLVKVADDCQSLAVPSATLSVTN